MLSYSVRIAACVLLASLGVAALGQRVSKTRSKTAATKSVATPAESAADRAIAARFAPVVYQALGDHPRGDYITDFDFDGDWRGDNNWANADDRRFPLKAYVYYSLSETATHYFIHYAFFHPRDYKGGGARGAVLSEAIKEGVRRGGKYDPTGLSSEAVLAHENDMEGCLVVVRKNGAYPALGAVVVVETLAHDRFLKYAAEGFAANGFARVGVEDGRPLVYVEPKGHGVSAFDAAKRQENDAAKRQAKPSPLLVYRFGGRAGNPEEAKDGEVAYELLPMLTTLWPRARKGVGETFGAARAYRLASLSVRVSGKPSSRKLNVTAGSAFLGKVGAANAARPPWGWFDRDERAEPAGAWFFDPAGTIKRHFRLGDDFSVQYLYAPFLGVTRR
ncbi:MAG TPA: hypothetical protein VNZ44_03565 [Pyrinomonadaceae bacterium]|nr:hypothetical protein [Pyrinomonadaceae bacterium]